MKGVKGGFETILFFLDLALVYLGFYTTYLSLLIDYYLVLNIHANRYRFESFLMYLKEDFYIHKNLDLYYYLKFSYYFLNHTGSLLPFSFFKQILKHIEKYINLANEHNCRAVLETKTVDGLKQSVEWLKKNI